MDIQRKLLSANPFSRPGKTLAEVKAVVLHWVANPGTSAMANRNYFDSLKSQSANDPKARYASAHFVVGIGGDVVQCLPTDEVAYHVGAKSYRPEAVAAFGHFPNNHTIGIELCHPKADGKFTEATLASAVGLSALLCVQFDLDPLADVWTHNCVTGKDCPKWFVDNPCDLDCFRHDVALDVGRLRGRA
ncbi:MAG: peptidoglycan recognition protein family protein [Treponema sp.]|nr:peptidoglycan recognition protein family protein [Treponema sp.]